MQFRYLNEVSIPIEKGNVFGILAVPKDAKAIIIFSHGSGSSRLSTRNQIVAKYLHEHNFGTLLFDLLSEDEDQDYKNRFDINLLATRLVRATEWISNHASCNNCKIGYFGASTGAASAIKAAIINHNISAIVSRGGRPDLALHSLPFLKVPTLLIVGELDKEVIQLNKFAYNQINCFKDIQIVEGATHLFEEEGKMDIVCKLATNWFTEYLL